MLRVLYTTNIPVPYRIDFFNALGQQCRLTACFEMRGAASRDRVWLSREARTFEPVFLRGFRIREDAALCPSISDWIKPRCFDVFVIGGYSTPTGMLAIEILRRRRIPFFLNCDGGFLDRDSLLWNAMKRHFIGSATWGLASGTAATEYLSHYAPLMRAVYRYPFSSVNERDVTTSPPSKAQKETLRAILGIAGTNMALCVGRFLPIKGFDIAIEAWTRLPAEYTLVIAGGGPEEATYRTHILRHGLRNVKIFGFQKTEELRRLYDAADLLVFPTRGDVWGLVINEAFARGLPAVSSDRCGAARDLLADGSGGMVVPVDDVDALADALIRLFNDERSLAARATRALEIGRGYTIEAMAARHCEAFNEARFE